MSWKLITDDVRLKLLALGLAVLMLGAVAFTLYQPTTRSLTVGLDYVVTSPDIILINPPAKTTVTYSGLADVIANVNTGNLIATVDATGARPGTAVRLPVTAHSLIGNVVVQTPPPVFVNVDTRQAVDVPVVVVARAANGWSIDATKTQATCPGGQNPNPCKVHFDGPVSWETNLKAIATFPGLAVGKSTSLNQPIQLLNSGGPVDFSVRTVPAANVDVTSADLHVEAIAGTTTASVALIDGGWIHLPSGYRVTGITITPNPVTITGDPSVLQRVRNIALPTADLNGKTSDWTVQMQIPYPDGTTGSVANATVTFAISQIPGASPGP